MNKILTIIKNADLRCGHMGLSLIAKSKKIDVESISPGEFVIFINSKENQLKAYAAGNVIAHLKTKDERRLNLEVIKLLPTYFSGGAFKYDAALKELFDKKLQRAA